MLEFTICDIFEWIVLSSLSNIQKGGFFLLVLSIWITSGHLIKESLIVNFCITVWERRSHGVYVQKSGHQQAPADSGRFQVRSSGFRFSWMGRGVYVKNWVYSTASLILVPGFQKLTNIKRKTQQPWYNLYMLVSHFICIYTYKVMLCHFHSLNVWFLFSQTFVHSKRNLSTWAKTQEES